MRTLQSQIGWCAKVQWVLAAAMLVLVGGFYLLGYRPAASQRAALRGQIQNTRRELEGNQARTQIKPIVEGKVRVSRAKLERFDKRLPRHQELSQFIGDISQLSRRSALRRWSTKMSPPKPSD